MALVCNRLAFSRQLLASGKARGGPSRRKQFQHGYLTVFKIHPLFSEDKSRMEAVSTVCQEPNANETESRKPLSLENSVKHREENGS